MKFSQCWVLFIVLSCGAPSIKIDTCGNGIIGPINQQGDPEACDDGNTISGDGCRADCRKQEVCGDGIIDFVDSNNNGFFDLGEPREECDDGNNIAGDGCRADCAGLEVCGDGIIDEALGEECDPPGSNCAANCSSLLACFGLGAPGDACTQSSDCCQQIGLSCLGDVCAHVDLFPFICGVGGEAHVCECSDGIDNDGDGGADSEDPFCLSAIDDDEGPALGFGFFGKGGASGPIECPFDGNSGPGNDGECNLFLPNGCDCDACCELDLNENNLSENVSIAFNCRFATPNPNVGTEGGPCTFVAIDDPNRGGCGTVDFEGATFDLACVLDGDGVSAYCSTCFPCLSALQNVDTSDDACINECNCCEDCLSGVQSPECDPALSGQLVDDDLDPNTPPIQNLCTGQRCETNIACAPATADIDCVNPSDSCGLGSNDTNVCFQETCDANSDCDSGSLCLRGCCVLIP